MGFWGDTKEEKIEELEKERRELVQRISSIEKELKELKNGYKTPERRKVDEYLRKRAERGRQSESYKLLDPDNYRNPK